jgi:SAM-dependent methyltransferase
MCSDIYAQPQTGISLDECEFYHTCEIPGIGLVEGQWDLRRGLMQYLGNYDFTNKRVLEIGPATGFLTFYMEKTAREVVATDLPLDLKLWDFVPYDRLRIGNNPTPQGAEVEKNFRAHLKRIRNGFWLCHEKFQSVARVCYSATNELPKELGMFDVAVLGSVLLHTQCPTKVLECCADFVTGSIVVTEMLDRSLGNAPICRLLPSVDNDLWHTWWNFTPQFFTQYLSVLGFATFSVSTHKQFAFNQEVELFTIVASRP